MLQILLNGQHCRNMKDNGAECGLLNFGGLTQEVSEEKNINMWLTHFCHIYAKNVTNFCSCPKSVPEVKVKRLGLILLTDEISKQPSIDSIFGY